MARTFTGSGNVGRVSDAKNGGAALAMNGASQVVAAANPARATLVLSNMAAANPMFFAFSTSSVAAPTAVVTSGLRLAAGQFIVLEAFTGAVAVIGTAADVLGIVEF